MKPIIDNLRSVGIATAVAAGNNGFTNALNSPGCISSAISVGATSKSDAVASFSNMASFMSVFAPGVSIVSSVTGGAFGSASGTSMAAAHVAGAWAVLRQAAPNASVDQILSALQTTGVPVTDTDSGVTKPRVRIDQALAVFVPTVSSIAPNQATPGAAVSVTINGSGFAGASLSVGAGISVSNLTVTSPTQLTATLTIAGGAALAARNVTVTNLGGRSGVLAGGFTVAAASVTVSSVTPSQGAADATVPVTIDGSGSMARATPSVGTGITASSVAPGTQDVPEQAPIRYVTGRPILWLLGESFSNACDSPGLSTDLKDRCTRSFQPGSLEPGTKVHILDPSSRCTDFVAVRVLENASKGKIGCVAPENLTNAKPE
jgi:hypothetical protein